jgi:RNA polymerase sigma-70 factor (ECF subfamily)
VSIKVMDYSLPMTSDAQQKQLLDADPDLPLMQAMAKKDSSALEELYQRHGARLLAYLSARLGDAGLAEEVLQDVMLSVWQNASRFRGECRVVTWLMAIARNRAINAFHRKLPASSAALSIDDPNLAWIGKKSPEIEKVGAYEGVQAALLAISEEQRETLELVFFHGLSLSETAYVQGISTGTVKSRLHRAKARIREIMEGEAKSNE